MTTSSRRFTPSVCLLFFCAALHAQTVPLPNASFESGKDKPSAWTLEGGAGTWAQNGRNGGKCISVTGTGQDCSYWRCDVMPLRPNTVYRVRFFTKTDAQGGCIITGSSFVNRDFRAGADWEEKSFVFRTPSTVDGGFIRFGQWHKKGAVWFDYIRFVEVDPIQLSRDGTTLGVGERIDNTTYECAPQMGRDCSNYSRCLVSHTAGFNSNRWTLGKDAEIIYRHATANCSQASATMSAGVHYHQSGELLVSARKDGGPWKEVGRFGKAGAKDVALPPDLFPAASIDVRLRATGTFQIPSYSYEARLNGTPPTFAGDTWFLETVKKADDVSVRVNTLGSLCPGEGNTVELSLSSKTPGPRELDVRLRMSPEEGEGTSRRASVSFAGTARTEIPYTLRSAGRYDLLLSATDRPSGAVVYEARSTFLVPPLYAADFGYALSGTEACELWWCESTYKISRERQTPTETDKPVVIRAARGEYEPFQVALRPRRDLKNVRLRMGELRGKGGNTIPRENVTVDLEAYVPVTVPTDALGCVGDWPDPLPPYEEPLDAEADRNHPIWITVHVPRDAAAGDYVGRLEIVPENAPAMSADVTLHVYDYVLPKEMHLQVSMNMSKSPLKRYHNLETAEEVERVFYLYNKNMAEHRVSNFSIMRYHRPEVTFRGANWNGGKKVEKEKSAGKKSLLVVDDDDKKCITVTAVQYVPVTPGETYEFCWAAKADGGHPYVVSLNQHDAKRQWISGHNIDLRREGTGGWKKERIVVQKQVHPNAKYLKIHLRPALWSEQGEHKGQAHFDEIVFRKLPDGKNLVTDPGFEHGVDDIDMEIDLTRFDEGGRTYLDGLGFNVFTVPLYGFGGGTFHSCRYGKILDFEQGTPEYMKLFSKYCRTVCDRMVERGWYEKSCVYWFDEPSPKDYAFVVEGMKCLKKAEPRLKRMLTEQPEPELLGHVDIWLPILNCFSREALWPRQKKGEVLWWYICCGPKTPYPNHFIDHPAIEPRIWFWMTWRERVTGCHIWQTNYWNGRLVYPPPDLQNPWEDPMSYVSGYGHEVGFVGYWGNGDGRSLYPPNRDPKNDRKKYLCGPVNCIRWELIREGIEDYETFRLLNEEVAALEKSGRHRDLVAKAKALLNIPGDIIEDLTHYTEDPRKLDAYRDKVSRMIERIQGAK